MEQHQREPLQKVKVANPSDGGFIFWLFKYYLFGGIVLGFAGLASLPALYLLVATWAPPPPDLGAFSRDIELATTIHSSDGQVLTALVDKQRQLAPMSEIPPLLIKAFLAAEDRSFYTHGGVDFRGILRAALANFKAGMVRQGGSTITQQVAKAYLSPARTIQRKLKEIVLARRIEGRYTKEEILYLYLNYIYLGSNAYGVKAAAQVYFRKDLKDLTLPEMALFAGLVRAPSRYSPRAHPQRALRRRTQVLRAMTDAGYITEAQRDQAAAHPLRLASASPDPLPWLAPHFTEHVRRLLLERYGKHRVYTGGWRVETTVDLPLHQLARQRTMTAVRALDKRQGWRGALFTLRSEPRRREFLAQVKKIYHLEALRVDQPYPTLITKVVGHRAKGLIGARRVEVPLGLMRWAAPYSKTNAENERTITSIGHTLRPGDVVWTISPPRWLRQRQWGQQEELLTPMALHQVPQVEGGIYHYDHHNGHVLAMVGGLDYDRSTFNRMVQACRQPGSTYKPIYYSLALNGRKFSMGTILHDKPYEPEPGEEWNPQNVHGTLDGKVTMHMSLVRSLNLPSIELLTKVGAEATKKWARRLGFSTPIHADKALALGASCVRTDELTRAFATFIREGKRVDPVYIRQVRDRQNNLIEDHTSPEDPLISEDDRLDRLWALSAHRPRQIIDPRTAFLMTKLLRDSVLHGIAARCRIVPAPTGGKGGTSSDTMDVWFVGSTSQWSVTAWIGDDTYKRPLGEEEASYTSAIPMWANYMKQAVGKRPHRDLPISRPPGLKSTAMDYITGKPPGPETKKTVTIYYRPGSYNPAGGS